MRSHLFVVVFALQTLTLSVIGWSFNTPSTTSSSRIREAAGVENQQSRASFIATCSSAAAAALLVVGGDTRPAFAKDVDAALKGTKKDPAFEACLSQCMYDCTKPKGAEQKSRAECLPECKKECATNKAQLMLGTPNTK